MVGFFMNHGHWQQSKTTGLEYPINFLQGALIVIDIVQHHAAQDDVEGAI